MRIEDLHDHENHELIKSCVLIYGELLNITTNPMVPQQTKIITTINLHAREDSLHFHRNV